MPLIINGNTIPVVGLNSNIDLERVVYRERCGTCNETGFLPGTEHKRCPTCQTNYPISNNACTTSGCANFGILGGLVSMPGTSCNTCGGGGYTTNETVWEKLYIYTLTISKGTGVNTITVTRTSTKNHEASTGVLSSGATIYTYDTLTVSATASSGYTLNSYTSSYTVSGNINVSITATVIPIPKAATPSISSSGTTSGASTVTYKNTDNVAGTLWYRRGNESWVSYAVSAGGTRSVTYYGTAGSGFYTYCYFVASGKSQSDTRSAYSAYYQAPSGGTCPTCNGTGEVGNPPLTRPCGTCDGTGYI